MSRESGGRQMREKEGGKRKREESPVTLQGETLCLACGLHILCDEVLCDNQRVTQLPSSESSVPGLS